MASINTSKTVGLGTILKNLNKEIQLIEGDISKGMLLGMQLIKRDSMDDTPVDTGNLRGSHYVVTNAGKVDDEGKSKVFDTKDSSGRRVASEHPKHVQESAANARAQRGPFAEVGCTAFYAEKVHEDLEASHTKVNKKGEGVQIGKAKFLEDSIRKNANRLYQLIVTYAKRK